MTGQLILSPDELARLVEAALKQSGYDVTGLALHDEHGQLVGYQAAVIHYNAPPIRIRVADEQPGGEAARIQALRGVLYPDVNVNGGTRSNG